MNTSSCGFSSLVALSLRKGNASPSPSDLGVLRIGSFSIVPVVLRGELPESSVFFGDSIEISGFKNSSSCSSQPKSGV